MEAGIGFGTGSVAAVVGLKLRMFELEEKSYSSQGLAVIASSSHLAPE